MRKAILNPPPGLKESSVLARQAAMSSRIADIRDLWRGVDKQVAGWAGPRFTQLNRDAVKLANTQAREAGVRPPGPLQGDFAGVDGRTVAAFATDTVATLRRATAAAGDKAERLFVATAKNGLSEQDINRILAGGVVEGLRDETYRRLRDEFQAIHGGKVMTLETKSGPMDFDIASYAQTVVRTRTREAAVYARHERLRELDLELVSIIGRISDTFCTAFLGQVFYIGDGKHDRYPSYDELPGGGPPFHPNCSKGTRPYVEELASSKQAQLGRGIEDAQAMLGMEPAEAQRAFKGSQIRTQVEARMRAA
jgi:hypothetical protein